MGLSAYAALPQHSRGRRQHEAAPQYRTEYQRDRDRIIHCGAFRRLEYKTQVFVNHEGDMFRTRLTHSIEVAQIGRTAARTLGLDQDLTEAICLAHDLGHTPFGHAGQDALNSQMADYGGFEHNIQSLRVVDQLEERYAEFSGLNLTYETREGILKHCSRASALQLGELGTRFLEGRQPGLEAQLANLADAIAYNNHDVDDGLRAGLLTIEQLREVELFDEQYREVAASYPRLSEKRLIHEIIRRMINRQVVDMLENSRRLLSEVQPKSSEDARICSEPLIAFSEAVAKSCSELKRFLRRNLYQHYRVLRMSSKAGSIIEDLFKRLNEDVRLLPPEHQSKVNELERQSGEAGRARAVADYIAGMTDRYAIGEHQRLFNPAVLT